MGGVFTIGELGFQNKIEKRTICKLCRKYNFINDIWAFVGPKYARSLFYQAVIKKKS